MRVWLYARLSNDDDREMNSLLNQREICQAFAEQHGYIIVGQSFDDNISGMSFDRRGLDELTAAVDADMIDAVIVKDLSRLGRHRTQTALFIDYLREHQVRVISATEGVDTFRDEDDLIIGVRGLMNDYYADDDFPILKSYIAYTFAKLWKDKQVYVSVNGQYSVFNTGLVNRNYQYIYVVFEKNVGNRPWRFLTFANPGVKYGGRILSGNFVSLPQPAHYFKNIDDISYVIATDKTPDEQLPDLQSDHYFVDHPDRLPIDFLRDGCRKNADIVALLNTDTSSMSGEEIANHWEKIGEAIGDDPEVYDDLEASFRNAVRKAIMRVSWNYRTAIPVYFPSYDKMSILLPLSFGTNSEAEVALVVERNATSQKYTAPTILSLPTAYANARLVCKPESDWLNQKVLEPVSSNITDSDE